MNFNNITKSLKGVTSVACQTIVKHSPTILMVGGTIGVVTSTVLACIATTKLNDTMIDSKEKIEKLHDIHDKMYKDNQIPSDDAVKTYQKSIIVTYAQAGVELVKLYAIPGAICVLSLGMMHSGKMILDKRYTNAIAYATSLEAIMSKLKKNIIDDVGEDGYRKYRYGINSQEIETPINNAKGEPKLDKNGNPKTKKEKKVSFDPSRLPVDDYSFFYEEGSTAEWDPSPEYNITQLLLKQKWANDLLQSRGYITYNEIIQMLKPDCKPRKEGFDIGYIYTKDNPMRVDFGLNEYVEDTRITRKEWMDEKINSILITFDGMIYIKDKYVEASKESIDF